MIEHNPYHPPQTEITPSVPLSSNSSYAYVKDPKKLTSLLIVLLWISLGFEVISVLGDSAQMALLSNDYTDTQAEANDARQGLIGLGYLGVFIFTGIVFLKWIYRANANSGGFGAQNMQFTPGWSVGYYFIPFINLVRPYQAMKEILQISYNPEDWTYKSVTPLLGWWWGLWLLSGFMGQLVFRLSAGAETIDDLKISTGLSIAAGALGIPLCLVAIKLIKTIAENQEQVVNTPQAEASPDSSPFT